jgi:hypothetical protein
VISTNVVSPAFPRKSGQDWNFLSIAGMKRESGDSALQADVLGVDLADVLVTWPNLPDDVRESVLTIMRANLRPNEAS